MVAVSWRFPHDRSPLSSVCLGYGERCQKGLPADCDVNIRRLTFSRYQAGEVIRGGERSHRPAVFCAFCDQRFGYDYRMPKTLPTVAEFLASLPDDRRDTMTAVHKAIRKAVPKLGVRSLDAQ